MHARDQELGDRAVGAFLLRFAADRDSGAVRPLSEYLTDYPSHEREVAQEYLTLTDAGLSVDEAAGVAEGADSGAAPGDQFGPFQVEREIGRGGQATVYAALDTRIGRLVALKVLHTTLGTAAMAMTERFRREAELLARLDHPGICVVHEANFDNEPPYIAMRFVAGESVGQKITAARAEIDEPERGETDERDHGSTRLLAIVDGLPEAERFHRILDYFESCARALHLAHDAGLVHRDIKPANLMATPGGDPVILDFGLAQEEQGGTACLTLTGQMLGTPAYMAPELLREGSTPADDPIAPDRRVDVYALGVALYECLTLSRPFHSPTLGGLYRKILRGDYAPVRRRGSRLPADIDIVVATALETSPDRRYQSAADFADDLRRVRRREPVHAKPAGVHIRAVRWVQRYPVLAGLLAVVVSALAVGLIVALALLGVAQDERDAKDATLGELERLLGLSDAQVLKQLEVDRDQLVFFPDATEVPEWLERTDQLLRRLPEHAAELERLRAGALPYTDDAVERDRRANAEDDRDLPIRIERLRERMAEADGVERETLATQIGELESQLNIRRTWEYADTADSWREAALTKLLDGLSAMRATGNKVRDEWEGVLALEQRIRDEDAIAWEEARAAVAADPRFAGFELKPQYGLVPVGRDRESGLLEFAHLPSGEAPARDAATGALEIDGQSAIVFVLLPAGTFSMGAERPSGADDARPNRDPLAREDEGPVHDVTLAPFFLAKHEVTQGQWLRLFGRNDSRYAAGETWSRHQFTLRNPAEWVPWEQGSHVARRYGLALPTEAQWEYGARAGSGHPWWTGAARESLIGAANLFDRHGHGAGLRDDVGAETWIDDGAVHHAPVGSYRANAFGLHDTVGNVMEWCRDVYAPYTDPPRPGDGLRAEGMGDHTLRGGSFYHTVDRVRSAHRGKLGEFYGLNIGVRFARAIESRAKKK